MNGAYHVIPTCGSSGHGGSMMRQSTSAPGSKRKTRIPAPAVLKRLLEPAPSAGPGPAWPIFWFRTASGLRCLLPNLNRKAQEGFLYLLIASLALEDYFQQIVLSGGTTMFPGMSSRLEKVPGAAHSSELCLFEFGAINCQGSESFVLAERPWRRHLACLQV